MAGYRPAAPPAPHCRCGPPQLAVDTTLVPLLTSAGATRHRVQVNEWIRASRQVEMVRVDEWKRTSGRVDNVRANKHSCASTHLLVRIHHPSTCTPLVHACISHPYKYKAGRPCKPYCVFFFTIGVRASGRAALLSLAHSYASCRTPLVHSNAPTRTPRVHSYAPARTRLAHSYTPTRSPLAHSYAPTRTPLVHSYAPTRTPLVHSYAPTRTPLVHLYAPARTPLVHSYADHAVTIAACPLKSSLTTP